MATDYAEKEREFLSDLKADTGRDLAQWMAAIKAQGFRDKNEVIDWLRTQGFMFWKASWLERVHHNGGRPIYADPASAKANAEIARQLLDVSTADLRECSSPPAMPDRAPSPLPPPRAAPSFAQPAPWTTAAAPSSELGALLAKAKGYRPLAEHVLRAIRSALPNARPEARGALVVLSDEADFAVIAISARELKLGLALGEGEPGLPHLVRTRIAGAPEAITHAVVLTDARQITPELLTVVRAAHGATRG